MERDDDLRDDDAEPGEPHRQPDVLLQEGHDRVDADRSGVGAADDLFGTPHADD